MRQLRWKNAFATGVPEIDRRNKSFVDCLNGLLRAAGERDHCNELDDFVSRLLALSGRLLEEGPSHEQEIPATIRATLTDAFPLSTFGTAACRECGLCDIGKQRLARHLDETCTCFTGLD